MTTLLIATRNRHKVQEIQAILGPEFKCLTLDEFPGAPTPVEDGATFAENAAIKARSLAGWLNAEAGSGALGGERRPLTPALSPGGAREEEAVGKESDGLPDYILADDSGLEVDGLGGAPGVHSARFAALDTGRPGNSPDGENNAKLLRLLKSVPGDQCTARFRCTLALLPTREPDGVVKHFDGTCEGRIQLTAAGGGGFGYDPLFVPEGYELSFAELGEEVKNRLSHRAKAVEKLRREFERGI